MAGNGNNQETVVLLSSFRRASGKQRDPDYHRDKIGGRFHGWREWVYTGRVVVAAFGSTLKALELAVIRVC